MENRAANTKRYKLRKPRQTSYQLESDIGKFKEGDESVDRQNTQRFSTQYLNLARKFKIKMLATGSSKSRKEYSANRLSTGDKIRVKTQISKSNMRYAKPESPINMLELRPHSEFINTKNTHRQTMRSNRLAMFNLNKNTVYNDCFIKLKTEPEKDKEEQMIKLNIKKGDDMLINLGYHCQKLWAIKQSLEKQSLNSLEVIRQVKQYVMRDDRQSISKIDKYFQDPTLKKEIKQLVLYQRMVLISIVSNIATSHLYQFLQESNRAIQIILGFWYQIVNNTYNDNIYSLEIQHDSDIKELISILSQAKLLTKSNLTLLLQTISHKMSVLFKFNRNLYHGFQQLRKFGQEMTINRAFYELLTIFAGYLAQFERKAKINLDNIAFFATCPSPYLIKSCKKEYTLMIDLDQTLLYCKKKDQKGKQQGKGQQILYRPGCCQFVAQLSTFYEIVIFTTSVQSYARDVTKNIKGIDYYLFRQHATRLKNGLVKDLSRVGRDIKKTVIVDDQYPNFRNNKDNGIRVASWRGDPFDRELDKIKQFLISLAKSKCRDVRVQIPIFKQKILRESQYMTTTVNLKPVQCDSPLKKEKDEKAGKKEKDEKEGGKEGEKEGGEGKEKQQVQEGQKKGEEKQKQEKKQQQKQQAGK